MWHGDWSSKLQFGECDTVTGPQICNLENVTQWLVLKFAIWRMWHSDCTDLKHKLEKSVCQPPDCRHTWPGKHVPSAHSCPEVLGTLVFVTQVCHYIGSLVQCWGFAWLAYYIDQETTVQPTAGVGGYSPVSTSVYSRLLLHIKVRVVGLDDRAMSFIGPLKCERHCPQRICKSKRCNSNMYRLSKSVTKSMSLQVKDKLNQKLSHS